MKGKAIDQRITPSLNNKLIVNKGNIIGPKFVSWTLYYS